MMEVDGSGWGLLPLHSNVKQMKWILSKGALVDLATEEGETPLMMAALSGATRGCQFLIDIWSGRDEGRN